MGIGSRFEVRPAVGRRDRRAFFALPRWLYAGDPNWTPPLAGSLECLLDPRRHPFHAHARVRLHVAWRGRRPVGRIAAIVNRLHNETHGDRTGFWGFFECVPEAPVARALLDAAADDLRAEGMDCMLGPFNPSINAECGLLVEGFDRPPALLMPYNPPSYPRLVEEAGLRPVKDLFAFQLDSARLVAGEALKRLERLSETVRRRHPDLTVRPLDMRRYEEEVVALGRLFNAARRDNWGFVPATEDELRLMAREMRAIVWPDFVLVAEMGGRRVGCILALPDVTPVLRAIGGRLFPFGWLRLLRERGRLKTARVFGAACLPEVRSLGITAVLFERLIANGLKRGIVESELSWVAEDNLQSVRTIEAAVRPRLYKRYRIYGRALVP